MKPVAFPDLSREEIAGEIARAMGTERRFIAVNAHTVYLAERDAEFREILEQSDCFCDGFGVHLLSLLQGAGKPEHRNTPTDFMWLIFERLSALGKTVWLVGDEPGVAEEFARLVNSRHPGLILGSHDGYFAMGSADEDRILSEIHDAKPDLICVGMGQPRQEKWAYRLRGRLGCPTFHIGASMAFAIGARRRGPKWATDHGLEWLFRVLHEPQRMFSRYFVETPWLAARAVRYRWSPG